MFWVVKQLMYDMVWSHYELINIICHLSFYKNFKISNSKVLVTENWKSMIFMLFNFYHHSRKLSMQCWLKKSKTWNFYYAVPPVGCPFLERQKKKRELLLTEISFLFFFFFPFRAYKQWKKWKFKIVFLFAVISEPTSLTLLLCLEEDLPLLLMYFRYEKR